MSSGPQWARDQLDEEERIKQQDYADRKGGLIKNHINRMSNSDVYDIVIDTENFLYNLRQKQALPLSIHNDLETLRLRLGEVLNQ